MSIQDGRIFFLGAGFSAGGGVPLTNTLLPKASEFFKWEAEGLFERVADYANQVDVNLNGSPDAEDFARLCTHLEFVELREHAGGERWSSAGCREKVALKFFLSKAIAQSTPYDQDIPQQYIKFAQALTSDDTVVTFNWDLLLERAINLVGKQYSYNWEDGKIQITKLHGSINWINNEPRSYGTNRRNFEYVPIGLKTDMIDNEVYHSRLLEQKSNWWNVSPLLGEVRPLIVLPGFGKAYDVRTLSTLWYKIEFLNIHQGGVSIIGLNVSQDDFIMESLFRYLFRGIFSDDRSVRILNPDQNAYSRFDSFCDGLKLDFKCERFDSDTLTFALHTD
ncbi:MULTISPECIES: hypothetical protein [Asticcacaulis]|uniref:hypothetical protein n=1 Tax=Asticcacaulis TaxID=76890 RepID=UPI001AE2FF6E|nr:MULTISPECIES: hypothetical protein [Asticcacaulis]MBP2158782.1 hypothetical protein [Asticcacaulis solisilvae]MDR6799828.1 hypothetical protein [Asticcacaulis sp. BE141]